MNRDKLPGRVLKLSGPARRLGDREWLVTNGLGGYASGTLSNVVTRRYHALLIAALPTPYGRFAMLNHLEEFLVYPDGDEVKISLHDDNEKSKLAEFTLDGGCPVWRYEVNRVVLERRLVMPHLQNTVYIIYRLIEGIEPLHLRLRPGIHFRSHEAPVNQATDSEFSLAITGPLYEITSGKTMPTLRLFVYGENRGFTIDSRTITNVEYSLEEQLGYQSTGSLWSPGIFRADLKKEQTVSFVASAENWDSIMALTPEEALTAEYKRERRLLVGSGFSEGFLAELALAADKFVISPRTRADEETRAGAAGDEVRTVIAGYHWFSDWGRDTMISLEGLTLVTGRHIEAGYIIRTFAQYVRRGLIPNLFPEGRSEGLYHTADATLWYFHAISRYLHYTGDWDTLRLLLRKLNEIVDWHINGTDFGIHVDPNDGLLAQGAEGYQLTWMDAKVGDWVVTPRRGKAVEINALWYNALLLLSQWNAHEGNNGRARELEERARRAGESFNSRYWYEEGRCLYDVVDKEGGGNDDSCRPNQILALSLEHPILHRSHWKDVFNTVKQRLLTPFGLRSLAPGHPGYKQQYYGDLRSRDAAYHQGTVWAWLIGPFTDAWLRVAPEEAKQAVTLLEGFGESLNQAGVGCISEIFDASEPYTPRGCIAQAWSVAEVLRALLKATGYANKVTE